MQLVHLFLFYTVYGELERGAICSGIPKWDNYKKGLLETHYAFRIAPH